MTVGLVDHHTASAFMMVGAADHHKRLNREPLMRISVSAPRVVRVLRRLYPPHRQASHLLSHTGCCSLIAAVNAALCPLGE